MQKNSTQFVNDKYLSARYGVSRNTVWRWTELGKLPRPIKFSHGCTRWNLAEVEAREQAMRSGATE